MGTNSATGEARILDIVKDDLEKEFPDPSSHKAQVATVKVLLEKLIRCKDLRSEIRDLNSEKPPAPPAPPTRGTAERVYPEVKSEIKLNIPMLVGPWFLCWLIAGLFFGPNGAAGYLGGLIYILLFVGGIAWLIFYYFKVHKTKIKNDVERIRLSAEYKGQCAQIDAEADAKQAEMDARYEAELKVYNEQTMPAFEAELADWNAEHDAKLATLRDELGRLEGECESIFYWSGSIPHGYRTVEALSFIDKTISTSNYDIAFAIQRYDDHRQRLATEQHVREQRYANELAAEANEIAENAARRAAQDARVSQAAAAAQAYQTKQLRKDLERRERQRKEEAEYRRLTRRRR